ncbi:MAG: sigma 54-interacting transcriptional regulator [Deltaproteobacteria bacterium]|nr:sigma 54-interacting transcriptional regulator [Deltaproteobacteria bacterium]
MGAVADCFASIIGSDTGLLHTVQKARLLATTDLPVLLQGETGVGKEVFARAIHDGGDRLGPFVAVNSGGLPRDLLASELFGYVDGAFTGARRAGMVGKIEVANGGTLFLDEIGELPLDLQPYLLRVLEGGGIYPLGSTTARTSRFRLIAASNRHLRSEVAAGRFRMDLFYRISATSLHIPPLRERKEDIPVLVEYFCRRVADRRGGPVRRFTVEALRALVAYPWPGNVRELSNAVEAMTLFTEGDEIGRADLPADIADMVKSPSLVPFGPSDSTLQRIECDAIIAALGTSGGNLTRAAMDLRIARSTLYLKITKYSLGPILRDTRRRPH